MMRSVFQHSTRHPFYLVKLKQKASLKMRQKKVKAQRRAIRETISGFNVKTAINEYGVKAVGKVMKIAQRRLEAKQAMEASR